jgi:sulfite exporter TauE/SafE
MTADLGKEAFYASLAIIGFVLGMLGIHCHRWNSLLRVAAIFFGLFLCAFGLGSTLIVRSERVSAAPGIIIALSPLALTDPRLLKPIENGRLTRFAELAK